VGLTRAQFTIWERARSLGNSGQAVALSDAMCAFIVARVAEDLGFKDLFSKERKHLTDFFSGAAPSQLQLLAGDPLAMFEKLVARDKDADTYFACLAALQKARLKYERILAVQPVPTFEQVGPRGLLQFGQMAPNGLADFLLWRKWFFDIDNRAGQETGYLFEPIIAHALGGTPAPARKSPVKRASDSRKGRQVDCILGRRAYEIKMRVTIAASGQGRWKEELDFPSDCETSGYTPVLVCFDSTRNPKLDALIKAFEEAGGESFVGDRAWRHLEDEAGPTMGTFIDLYVRSPLESLLKMSPDIPKPLCASWTAASIHIEVGGVPLVIARGTPEPSAADDDEIPDDVDDELL
jgi:hypothetical protein